MNHCTRLHFYVKSTVPFYFTENWQKLYLAVTLGFRSEPGNLLLSVFLSILSTIEHRLSIQERSQEIDYQHKPFTEFP
jgi:hypothetical protein